MDVPAIVGTVLGGAAGILLIVAVVGAYVLLFLTPWMTFSIMRSVKRQAQQLERIADAIEHANRGGRDEVRDLELARRNRA